MSSTYNPKGFRINNNVEEIAAPQLLGAVWNWFLYGALVVQFYVYSYNFPRDPTLTKLLVYFVFFLESLQTAFSGADLYYWFAVGFGKIDHLDSRYLSFLDVQVMGSIVASIVQCFFVYRIWVLSDKRWWWRCVCIMICLLSFLGAIGAFLAGLVSYNSGTFITGLSLQIFETTWLVANTLSDSIIASAMLYHLRRVWSRDGNLSNHALVSIVRLTVETNLATTTVSVASLLMISLYPQKNWYACPTYILGKLYSNTLLVSLNNRIAIRDTHAARGGLIGAAGPGIATPPARNPIPRQENYDGKPEKPQKDLMGQPDAETEVREDIP